MAVSPGAEFTAVAAIDFGTTRSGYAFAYTTTPDVFTFPTDWVGGRGVDLRTLTSILLDRNTLKYKYFGYEAQEEHFEERDDEECKEGGSLFFETFKMSLYTKDGVQDYLTSSCGQRVESHIVFREALAFMKGEVLKKINKANAGATAVEARDIMWVITVPGIWRDKAKMIMRKAAKAAEMGTHHNLMLAVEPEAASLHVRAEFKKIDQLPEGSKYILVDCGGGTVGFACHKISEYGVHETHPICGGPWGSMCIDKGYVKLLCDIFSEDAITKFKVDSATGWLQVMNEWEAAKSRMTDFDKSKRVPLPHSLIKALGGESQVQKECKIYTNVSRDQGTNQEVKFTEGLKLNGNTIKSLYTPMLDGIINQIRTLLQVKEVRDSTHLFVVGDFSASEEIIQQYLDSHVPQLVTFIPVRPSLAVMIGAVRLGQDTFQVALSRKDEKIEILEHTNTCLQKEVTKLRRSYDNLEEPTHEVSNEDVVLLLESIEKLAADKMLKYQRRDYKDLEAIDKIIERKKLAIIQARKKMVSSLSTTRRWMSMGQETKLKNKDAQIKSLKSDVKTAKSDIKTVKNTNKALEKHITSLQKEKTFLQGDKAALEARKCTLEKQNKQHESDRLANLREEKRLREERNYYRQHVDQANQRYRGQQLELTRERSVVTEYKKLLEKEIDDHNTLKELAALYLLKIKDVNGSSATADVSIEFPLPGDVVTAFNRLKAEGRVDMFEYLDELDDSSFKGGEQCRKMVNKLFLQCIQEAADEHAETKRKFFDALKVDNEFNQATSSFLENYLKLNYQNPAFFNPKKRMEEVAEKVLSSDELKAVDLSDAVTHEFLQESLELGWIMALSTPSFQIGKQGDGSVEDSRYDPASVYGSQSPAGYYSWPCLVQGEEVRSRGHYVRGV